MSLSIWRPFDELRRLESDINSLFQSSYRRTEGEGFYMMPIDVTENNDQYEITAHLPGFNSDEVNIEATSQYLELKAEKEENREEQNEDNFVLREIKRVNFRRRITFDKPVKTTEAKTTLKDGVLKIIMPKMEEAKAVKLIPEQIE